MTAFIAPHALPRTIRTARHGPTCNARVRFPGLRADAFRHPVDVQATATLRRLLGLEGGMRTLLRAVEVTMGMENAAMGVRVGAEQMGGMHGMLEEACAVLDMDVPELYVRQNPVPNAYTLAMQGGKPFIVVHSALIELLQPKELQAVLAHECGHLVSEHGVWVTMANLVVLGATGVFSGEIGRLIYELLNTQLLRWQRSAEFTCDRAALLVVQDARVVVSALMKLAGGSLKYAGEMDVDAYLAQADQFDEVSSTRIGRMLRDAMTTSATHPLPVLRVRELKRWSGSNHYLSLVRGGKPMAAVGDVSTAGSTAASQGAAL